MRGTVCQRTEAGTAWPLTSALPPILVPGLRRGAADNPVGDTLKRISLACLVVLAPVVAWANIIPTGTSITGAGPFTWTYNLQLSRDQDVVPGLPPEASPVAHENLSFGSFLTIFDFAGYVDGTCAGPVGWSCTVQNVGFTPDDTLPLDDAALPNLTWVYTSGPVLGGHPDGLDLGFFSAQSIFDTVGFVSYAARGVKNSGDTAGTIADNVGTTRGPVALEVPEPGSLALGGLALALMAVVRPRRKSPSDRRLLAA